MKKQFPFAALLTGFVAIVLAIPLLAEAKTSFPIFSLQFNVFAVLSAIGLAANIIVVTLLVRRQQKTFDSLWLIVGNMAVTLFAAGELLQRLSTTPGGAIFWAQISGMGVSFAVAFYLLFAINYAAPEKANAFTTGVVLIGAMVIAMLQANTSVLYDMNPQNAVLYPWGYYNNPGQANYAYIMWFTGTSLMSVILFLRFRSRTNNRTLRAQASIFTLAILIPIVGGIIFDSVLPLLDYNKLPPLSVVLFTASGIMMVLGLWRYRVLELSPVILSQNILTTMNEAVIVTNEALEIEFVNAEAEKMLSHESSTLYSQRMTALFTNSERLDQLRANLMTNGFNGDKLLDAIQPIEDMFIQNDTLKRYLRILVAPISRSGHIEGFIFVISDVTQLQQAYIELEAAKAGVEQTVAERTRDLQTAQQKLLENDKLKTEFIMLASHNLRTPLAAIRVYIELLQFSQLDGTQRHVIDNLDTSAKRLLQLTESLLTISAIEAGQEPMERTILSAGQFLATVTETAGKLAASNNNTFTTNIDVGEAQVTANADRLAAAINNLLDNAFRYTRNGMVNLTATADTNAVKIIVNDSGTGIKAEELSKLFTTFHRGTDTLQYDYDGKGLGLYLTKLIITGYAGAIDVQSQEGQGTQVTVTLPVVKQAVDER